MSQAQQFPHQGSSAHAAALELAATLLPVWGFPTGTSIALADAQGVNNQTFLVRHRQRRYVLRVTGFLSVAEVRAEHRILRRLAAERPSLPGTGARGRGQRADGDRDPSRARDPLPVAAWCAPRRW